MHELTDVRRGRLSRGGRTQPLRRPPRHGGGRQRGQEEAERDADRPEAIDERQADQQPDDGRGHLSLRHAADMAARLEQGRPHAGGDDARYGEPGDQQLEGVSLALEREIAHGEHQQQDAEETGPRQTTSEHAHGGDLAPAFGLGGTCDGAHRRRPETPAGDGGEVRVERVEDAHEPDAGRPDEHGDQLGAQEGHRQRHGLSSAHEGAGAEDAGEGHTRKVLAVSGWRLGEPRISKGGCWHGEQLRRRNRGAKGSAKVRPERCSCAKVQK